MSKPLKFSPSLQDELAKHNFKVAPGSEHDNFLELADVVSVPSWPEFMMHDDIANKNWQGMHEKFSDFQFALMEGESGRWIAVGNSIPVHFSGALEKLPDRGWDWALQSGMEAAHPANLPCALAIQILPSYRSRGISGMMVRIMKEIGQQAGLMQLIAPVRPNKKCDYPLIPMDDYITWSRNGEHFDPWLRVHQRLGARILNVCPQAMKIYGSIADWQEWTSLSFQSSGNYVIPGGLASIEISLGDDRGVYVEPNVWMLHS